MLLPAAALAVHQLRYWLAYGDHANAQLIAQGHSYLHSLVPWTILSLAAAGGMFLRRLAAAARAGDADTRGRRAGAVWGATWLALIAIYATQEALEGFLATGHPGGLAGVFGHGGWWAVPAAAVVAAGVTLLLLLGRALVRAVAAAQRTRYDLLRAVVVPRAVETAVVRPLALAAAGRAPPFVLPSR
jgi:hypothetical protein